MKKYENLAEYSLGLFPRTPKATMPIQTVHWNKEYDRLSRKSDSDIYRELSRKVTLRGLKPWRHYAVPGNAKHGKGWFERKLAPMRRKICTNRKIRRLIRAGEYTERDLFIVLADVLSSLKIFVPVGTIAMILARLGLTKFCGAEKS